MSSLLKQLKNNASHHYERFSMEDFVGELENQGHSSVLAGTNDVKFSLESFADDSRTQQVASDLYAQMSKLTAKFGIENHVDKKNPMMSQRQVEQQNVAGTMAALACSDQRAYIKALKRVSVENFQPGENVVNVKHSFAGGAGAIQVLGQDSKFSLENYDEKSQRDFRVITVGYNLAASRQDEFAERIYPTSVINPIEGGVVQVLPYIAVMKDVYHSVSGQYLANGEVNMVEAYRDPSILDDESTDLVPAIDEAGTNLGFFVDPALVAPVSIATEQGLTYETAPLKTGINLDLMGNSNANVLISKGMLDISDTIDPAGRLRDVYLELEGNLVKFKVDRMERAKFQPDLIGDTRGAKVDFWTDSLLINEQTRFADKSTPAFVADLIANKWTVRMSVYFNAHISLSRGDSRLSHGTVKVAAIIDENGNQIDLTAGAGKTFVDSLALADSVAAVDFALRFTNTNRRQRGHLLQSRAVQFRHPIPMHAPVTLPMSTLDDGTPTEVIKALTVNTNLRNSNNAVKRLLNYVEQLRTIAGTNVDRPEFGAVEGALSMMMRPTYRYKSLHLPDVIDSLKSQDRWEDVCSAILNTVKGVLFPAYRESNIEAAFRVISGNQDERPMFIFASDKEIANYLMVKGDDRTLGAYLKYDIVSTNNELFDGKLIVIPTRENPQENDILSFGQFYYVSTIVADLPITRTGSQVSREIAAIPFNIHVNNIPFALEFDITGFTEVMGESTFTKPLSTALKP